MTETTTLTLLVAGIIGAGFSLLGIRKPYEYGRVWVPPWHGILFISILTIFLMLAHLVTLKTGQPFVGRNG